MHEENMSETNKSYRIRTEVGKSLTTDCITVDTTLTQDFDTFEILSLKINAVDTYKLHNSNYGVVVGRVLANNGFGVPNAKVSIFIEADSEQGAELSKVYPYKTTSSKNSGVKYNLLPDEQVGDCHQVVGTFPNKRYMLDNDVVLEMYDKYFTFTTRTNASGDYIIMGVPVGQQTIHMDLDLSDCGILSQKPRDLVYKGYTIEQFENGNKFKNGKDLNSLTQIISMDKVINVNSFWGNSSLGETIGITRCDMEVSYKFEPTCVFLGSAVSDNSSNGISKKCIPTERMGAMEELVAGKGTIEMIRKTPSNSVESFEVKGTEVINADGVWCYQIPMNLDYITTDEYGNVVPTDDTDKGIPTRARVRFRLSLQDSEANVDNFFRPKVLIPHNPLNNSNGTHEAYDYEFGTYTAEESYRDLFWNNVYSVKSYIPRFQKRKVLGWKTEKFSGFKGCNYYGNNNPIPYNNIRVRLPFQFRVICAIIKAIIAMTGWVNTVISTIGNWLAVRTFALQRLREIAQKLQMITLKGGLCPDLENWYFAPMKKDNRKTIKEHGDYYNLLQQTYKTITDDEDETKDNQSIDEGTNSEEEINKCLTIKTDYLISCIEMNLADTYRVINFDFYNDWINGLVYLPRFMRYVKKKKNYRGTTLIRAKVKGCMDDTATFSRSRRFTQMCAVGLKGKTISDSNYNIIAEADTLIGKNNQNKLGKKQGFKQSKVFGKNGGVCHEKSTMHGQYVYYLKPCEWNDGKKTILYATDIILLGSLNDCDTHGIPKAFKHLVGSTYIMPTNLALTNLEEAGTLYATTDGTICSGTQNYGTSGIDKIDISKGGLSKELKYFSGATDADVDYNDESDTIAVTEAAGVSWNWTGPGQGTIDKDKLYYPGGHFLGLACNNAEINVKSCINLERICELGTEMSQRREDVSGIDGTRTKYVYSAPTGLISGDDIVDEDFRSMFATMNHRRLLATKTDSDTGYKSYYFNYLRPSNFNGALNEITKNGAYNININVIEESSMLEDYGVTNGKEAGDYDDSETESTQTRTRESSSVDYYMFRYGLNLNNLNASNTAQENSFLIKDNNYYYMPQYENSYYFYFGLKQGATAIDEFNSQFYANCEATKLISTTPSMDLSAEMDICKSNCEIKAIIEGIETPYQSIVLYDTDTNKIVKNIDGLVDSNTGATDEAELQMLYSNEVVLSGLPWGNYKLSVLDSRGDEHSQEISVGQGLFNIDYTVVSYNKNATINKDNNSNRSIFDGGYIKINNIEPSIDGLSATFISIYDEKGEYVNSEEITTFPFNIFVKGVGKYIIKVSGTFGECKFNNIPQEIFTITDNSALKVVSEWDSKKTNLLTQENNFVFSGDWWVNYLKEKTEDEENTLQLPLKRSFFKKNEETEAFNCGIKAVGGDLIEWATPQKSNEFTTESGMSLCSKNVTGIPAGYTVENSNAFIYTFADNKYNKVAQRSAIVVSGNTVGGNYAATVSGSKITQITKSRFRQDCGMVFKPLDDTQELVYLTYNSGYSKGTSLSGYIGEKKDGVLYPAFVFPTINRPFKADADIMIWDYLTLEQTGDTGGWTNKYQLTSSTHGGVLDMTVYNGITKKDDEGKRIFPSFSASFGTSIVEANNEDMWGAESANSNNDRRVEVYGITEGETFSFSGNNRFNGNDFYENAGYSITEDGGDSISKSVGQRFYDEIDFFVDSQGQMHLYGKGGDDSEETEYALYIGNTTGSYLTAAWVLEKNRKLTNGTGYTNDYPFYSYGTNSAWACAPFVYTTKGENYPAGTWGLVEVYFGAKDSYKIAKYYNGNNGKIEKEISMEGADWWRGTEETVHKKCRRFFDSEIHNEEIKLIRHRLPSKGKSPKELIKNIITENTAHTGFTKLKSISSKYKEEIWNEQHDKFYYVVGKISETAPNGGKINLYKLYPTIIQVNNPVDWGLSASMDSIRFETYPDATNHAKLSLSGDSNAVLSLSKEMDWVTISGGGAYNASTNTVTLDNDGYATLDIEQQSYTTASGAPNREGTLVFTFSGQVMKTIYCSQCPPRAFFAYPSQSAVSFNQAGGKKTIMMKTSSNDIKWALSGLPSWCVATPSSGTGRASVTLSCSSSADGVNRSKDVTIATQNTYGTKAKMTIAQTGQQYYELYGQTITLNSSSTGITSSTTIIGTFKATGATGNQLKITNYKLPTITLTQQNFGNGDFAQYNLRLNNTPIAQSGPEDGVFEDKDFEWTNYVTAFSVSANTNYNVVLETILYRQTTGNTTMSLTAKTTNNKLYFDVE